GAWFQGGIHLGIHFQGRGCRPYEQGSDGGGRFSLVSQRASNTLTPALRFGHVDLGIQIDMRGSRDTLSHALSNQASHRRDRYQFTDCHLLFSYLWGCALFGLLRYCCQVRLDVSTCHLSTRFAFCHSGQIYLLLLGNFLCYWGGAYGSRGSGFGGSGRLASLNESHYISTSQWRLGPSLYDSLQINSMLGRVALG